MYLANLNESPLPEDEPKYDKFMVDCSRFITYLRSVYDKQLFSKRFEILVKCSKIFLKIRNRSETYWNFLDKILEKKTFRKSSS